MIADKFMHKFADTVGGSGNFLGIAGGKHDALHLFDLGRRTGEADTGRIGTDGGGVV